MSEIGLTGNVADAAGANGGESTQDSAFSFMQDQQGQQQAQPENTGNPAWKPFLDVLPTSLHPTVTPVLQQWDKGVQDRFTQVQQQYEPWKPFIDQGIDPSTIQGLLNLLENDPKSLWENLGQYHGFTGDQGQGEQQNGQEFNLDEIQDPDQQFDLSKNPEFQQIKIQNEQMRQAFEAQIQQQQQAQMMSQLEQEINAVKEKDPTIVEPVLLSLMHTFALSAEDAAVKYKEIQQQMLQGAQRPAAPSVLSPTGGVPAAQGIKPSEMSRGDKRNLVAEMLRAAATQNN